MVFGVSFQCLVMLSSKCVNLKVHMRELVFPNAQVGWSVLSNGFSILNIEH